MPASSRALCSRLATRVRSWIQVADAGDLPRRLRPGGERRGEEAASNPCNERSSVHQPGHGPRCGSVWEGRRPATSRRPRPNQRGSQRSNRLFRRGNQETRRASWRGGLDRPEISSRVVVCPPELQVPPNWVRQAPYARRFRTKAARSPRCAGGICAVVARCSRQYTGRVAGGPFPRISRSLTSWARDSITGAIVAE